MIATYAEFTTESKQAMADRERRSRINEYAENYRSSFNRNSSHYSNMELARKRAARLRWKTINHLDKYLIEFESHVLRSGGKVIWAQDQDEAIEAITLILKRKDVSKVVTKSNSVTGNLAAHALWQQQEVEAVETDYGHYILQEDQDKATHTVVPALHKSTNEVAEALFKTEELNDKQPLRLAQHIRKQLRHTLINASATVSAAQFIIADSGAAVLCDDEGATMLTSGLSKTSIVVADIDSAVANMQDLDLLLSLYSTFSTGQPLKTYNTIIKGPKQTGEVSGPEELYIVLLDNNKSDVLAHEHQRQVLSCINCGACLSASAIYKTVGGKAYPGPAKSIAAPMAYGATRYKYLSDLATLDGSGSEICPVKINFPRLVLRNRNHFVQQGLNTSNEKWFFYAWTKAMLKRDLMSWAGVKARNKVLENYFKSREGLRTMPQSAQRSFNQQWRDRMAF